jgi:hypothetical protein
MRLLSLLLVLGVSAAIGAGITGCAGDGPDPTPTTPSGQANVVITATAGTATQQTTVAVTVK